MSDITWPSDVNPQFPVEIDERFSTHRTPFETGHTEKRARWSRGLRTIRLTWATATQDEVEKVQSFAQKVRGATPFDWALLDPEKKPRPYGPATLGQVVGGVLGARTRYVKFTWADSSDNETEASYEYDSLAISSSYLLTATVPIWPQGVAKAYVYVGPSAGTYYRQTTPITTLGGTWTEPVGGYSTGGSSPPSSNSFVEVITVTLVEDRLAVRKVKHNAYAMSVLLAEDRA